MSKDPSGSAAINYTVETPKVHTFIFIFISIEFFRSKIFRRENFRPHIPIPNFLKIPKITLRKSCDEAWCLKTKYIIQNHVFYTVLISTFRWFRSDRKNNCLYVTPWQTCGSVLERVAAPQPKGYCGPQRAIAGRKGRSSVGYFHHCSDSKFAV